MPRADADLPAEIRTLFASPMPRSSAVPALRKSRFVRHPEAAERPKPRRPSTPGYPQHLGVPRGTEDVRLSIRPAATGLCRRFLRTTSRSAARPQSLGAMLDRAARASMLTERALSIAENRISSSEQVPDAASPTHRRSRPPRSQSQARQGSRDVCLRPATVVNLMDEEKELNRSARHHWSATTPSPRAAPRSALARSAVGYWSASSRQSPSAGSLHGRRRCRIRSRR